MDVPVAANVLGTLGAVCWSIQLIPQIVINYKRHHATGLQPSMMMLWAWAGVPLGVYNIVEDFNVALRIQPQILTFLSLATWTQCYYYQKKMPVLCALLIAVPNALVMGGMQAALIIALRVAKSKGLQWPLILMAALSAALLAAGVLRHYWDIWVHRTVRGISFIFVGIDAAGDLFSLVSIFFQPTPDVLGMVIYGTELLLWCGVFACGGYYNFVPWVRKRWSSASPSPDDGSRHDLDTPNPPGTQQGCSGSAATVTSLQNSSSSSVFSTAPGGDSGPRLRTGLNTSRDDGNVTLENRTV